VKNIININIILMAMNHRVSGELNNAQQILTLFQNYVFNFFLWSITIKVIELTYFRKFYKVYYEKNITLN